MKLYGFLISFIFLCGFSIIGYYWISNEDLDLIQKSNVKVMAENKNLTEKDAIKLVKEYMKKKNMYIPKFIEVDSRSQNIYTIHAYDVINNEEESHIATSGWFDVDIYTGKVVDIIGN